MRDDLSRIVDALIRNIGRAQVSTGGHYGCDNLYDMQKIGNATADGLEVLKNTWPNLTEEEKCEIAATILAVRETYSKIK